jgi:hypothetical protein
LPTARFWWHVEGLQVALVDLEGLGRLWTCAAVGHLYVVTRDVSGMLLNVGEMSPALQGDKGQE